MIELEAAAGVDCDPALVAGPLSPGIEDVGFQAWLPPGVIEEALLLPVAPDGPKPVVGRRPAPRPSVGSQVARHLHLDVEGDEPAAVADRLDRRGSTPSQAA